MLGKDIDSKMDVALLAIPLVSKVRWPQEIRGIGVHTIQPIGCRLSLGPPQMRAKETTLTTAQDIPMVAEEFKKIHEPKI